jgi:hypothetical protein
VQNENTSTGEADPEVEADHGSGTCPRTSEVRRGLGEERRGEGQSLRVEKKRSSVLQSMFQVESNDHEATGKGANVQTFHK